jgi:hypothetical protein
MEQGENQGIARSLALYLGLIVFVSVPVQASWTRQTSSTSVNLNAVTWTGTRWLAVGDAGVILSSSNAVHWSPESSGVSASLSSVAGVDSVAAVAGQSAYPPEYVPGTVLDSGIIVDVFPEATLLFGRMGAAWTKKPGGSLAFYAMAAKRGGPWVAAGNIVLRTSSNGGVTWGPGTFDHANVYSVTYSPTLWVMAGFRSTGTIETVGATIQTSTDAKTWTQVPALPKLKGGGLASVAWNDNLFVAVGSAYKDSGADSGKVLLTSPNGSAWTPRRYGSEIPLKGVAGVPGRWVAVGNEGTIRTSPDGITWSAEASGTTKTLRAVASNTTHFIAVGDSGLIITRPLDSIVSIRPFSASNAGPRVSLTQASGSLRIHVPDLHGRKLQATLYDLEGRRLRAVRGEQDGEGLSVSLAGLGAGTYWVDLRGQGLHRTLPFAISR